MTMPSIKYLVILLVFSASAPAQAATFQWLDDNGVTHVIDNTDGIPARYLNRVQRTSAGPLTKDQSPADSSAPPTVDVSDVGGGKGAGQNPYRELKAIKLALPAKKKELARLRHKWVVAKGRMPSEEELLEFEEKRAKGKATHNDNPYVNKNPLSTPGPARSAYYQKMDEIKKDEDRVRRLEKDIESLNMGINPAGAPVER